MPVYRITTRDGRQFDVTLREGVTPEQALPELEQMVAGMPAAAPQPERASTEDVNLLRDIPGSLVSGVGQLVGLPAQVYGLATGDFDTWLGDISGGISKFGQDIKSPGLRERERLAGEKIEAAAGQGIGAEVGTALETYLTDPRLLLSGVAETVPSLVGSLGAGTLARAGVRGATRLAGREMTEAAAKRAAVSGAVGFGAAQQGADVGAQTYIGAMETPDDVWNRNPGYIARVEAGEDPTQVKQSMALDAARQAAVMSGTASLATAAILPGVEKMILGSGVAGGFLKRGLKGAGSEALQEGLEEGAGQFAENVGMQTIEPGRDLSRGVAGAATVGAILGGGMGAPVAALNPEREVAQNLPPPPAPPVQPPSEGLLGILGQPGETIRIREGENEVPYIFRGVDDTGRVLIEDEGGNVFAEDPLDIEGAIVPGAAPPAPPTPPVPPAPPTVPTTPPVEPVPPVAPVAPPVTPVTPPVTPPIDEPLAGEPPVTPPIGEPATPPVSEPPVAEPPTEKPFTPFQPADKPVIQDEETRNFWRSSLARQRGELVSRRDALVDQATSLQENSVDLGPEDIDDYRAQQDALSKQIDEVNNQIASVDEDIQGVELDEAPVPRARPLDDATAIVANTGDNALADAVRNRTAAEVMDWFASNASTDFHRAVAKRIGNLLKAMEQAGFEFNWGVYDKNYKPKDAAEEANYKYVMKKAGTKGAAWTQSQYGAQKYQAAGYRNLDKGFDRVDIGVKDAGSYYGSGTNEVTILHEFAHAVTVAAISQLREKKISENSRVGQAVKELQSLKRAAVKHKNQILKDIADGKPVDPRLRQAVERLESSNAWDNEKELIVQGLSNIDMQIVLKSMPYKKTNGFVEFIREIGRLIGMTEKDMNGLRRLFELTDELIPTDTAAQQDVIQAMMKPDEYNAAQAPAPTPAIEAEPTAVEPTAQADVDQAIEDARKVPSLSRRVDRMVREWRAGRITDAEFMNEVADWSDFAASMREAKRYGKQTKGRQRGADYIRQRLLEAKRRGDISEDAADFAEWFIQRNPSLVDELGISMRKPKVEGRYTGTYDPLRRLMTLLKGSASDSTAVHEMMHHFERMMPEDIQEAIRTSWKKAFVKASKKSQTQQEKDYFAALDAFHNGKSITDGSGKQLPPSAGYDIAMEIGAKLPYDFYQYMNPSEFWAVNATDIMQGRYDVQGSTLGRLKGWLRDLGQKIKGLFGLPSKAPILKALDSLSNADGRFQSLGMLQNANVTLADAEAEPTAPTSAEILMPEEQTQQVTSEAASAPVADAKKQITEAVKPTLKLYNLRSEVQEKNRGCD